MLKQAGNDWKGLEMAGNGLNGTNDQKWLKMTKKNSVNGSKWLEWGKMEENR